MLAPVMWRHDIGSVADNDRAISWRGGAGKVAKQRLSGWVRRMVADLRLYCAACFPTRQNSSNVK